MPNNKSTLAKLLAKHSREQKPGSKPLPPAKVKEFLNALPGWKQDNGQISKKYSFEDYYETMAFVNALAWISHAENHHPDLEVGYNKCIVKYSTHSVGGLSENDFICAAKANALIK